MPSVPPVDPYARLIDRFRRRRAALGIPVRELGPRIGVTDSLPSRWECQDKRPSLFLAVCWAQSIGGELVIVPAKRQSLPCPEQLSLPL